MTLGIFSKSHKDFKFFQKVGLGLIFKKNPIFYQDFLGNFGRGPRAFQNRKISVVNP